MCLCLHRPGIQRIGVDTTKGDFSGAIALRPDGHQPPSPQMRSNLVKLCVGQGSDGRFGPDFGLDMAGKPFGQQTPKRCAQRDFGKSTLYLPQRR